MLDDDEVEMLAALNDRVKKDLRDEGPAEATSRSPSYDESDVAAGAPVEAVACMAIAQETAPTGATPATARDMLNQLCQRVEIESVAKMFPSDGVVPVITQDDMSKKQRLIGLGFAEDSPVLECAELVNNGKILDPLGRLGKLFSKVHKSGDAAHELYNRDRRCEAKNSYTAE